MLLGIETVVVIALQRVVGDSFGAVFLLGVLVVSAGWGFLLALGMSVVSAVVYVLFHIEDGSDGLAPALFVFLVLALLVNLLAGQARLRAEEAEQRRREADLSAELARVMLRADALPTALEAAGQRMAEVLGLPFARITLGTVDGAGGPARQAIPLADGGLRIGTLLVPADLDRAARRRVRRMVPGVEALLAAARAGEDEMREARRDIEAGHARVAALADQQTALRHVATLVAGGAAPAQVYPEVVRQLGFGLRAEHATLVGYTGPERCVVLATCDPSGRAHFGPGADLVVDGDSVVAQVLRTGRPARVDDYALAAGEIASHLLSFGLRSGVGAPVVVDGTVRGALIIGAVGPMPAGTEEQVADFADLVATAIGNAETRAELTASRARIVAAADHARRGFERDLHDGAQQRLVALGLELRAVEAAVTDPELREMLHTAVDGLGDLHSDLQELSRGLHPAVLSRGGLAPAVRTLARRSTVAVVLDLPDVPRLPESIEVAAYYVIAESLTNAAKHAAATEIEVGLRIEDEVLRIRIADDGVGGARAGSEGSGLIGLKDRVEALSGGLQVESPPERGTTVTARIPLQRGADTGR
ncbi:GAF domain-containing protein [Nakamurella sp. YIM 132087]|uniref:histidine kinase n=2 Tax=Nakamurella alba TaxID=2665158 RepID=A0A7K1FNY4_9ACTN|nr:GAF domain-containing protein [Nakamurella alba]